MTGSPDCCLRRARLQCRVFSHKAPRPRSGHGWPLSPVHLLSVNTKKPCLDTVHHPWLSPREKVLLDAVPVYLEPVWMKCGSNSSRAPKNQETSLPKTGEKCIGCNIYRPRIATENIWKAANVTTSEWMVCIVSPHCNISSPPFVTDVCNRTLTWRVVTNHVSGEISHEMSKYQPLITAAQAEKAVNLM